MRIKSLFKKKRNEHFLGRIITMLSSSKILSNNSQKKFNYFFPGGKIKQFCANNGGKTPTPTNLTICEYEDPHPLKKENLQFNVCHLV